MKGPESDNPNPNQPAVISHVPGSHKEAAGISRMPFTFFIANQRAVERRTNLVSRERMHAGAFIIMNVTVARCTTQLTPSTVPVLTHAVSPRLGLAHCWSSCLVLASLRASHSGTFLQTLPEMATPLKGHSLSPRGCPPTLSAPSEKEWILTRLEEHGVQTRT